MAQSPNLPEFDFGDVDDILPICHLCVCSLRLHLTALRSTGYTTKIAAWKHDVKKHMNMHDLQSQLMSHQINKGTKYSGTSSLKEQKAATLENAVDLCTHSRSPKLSAYIRGLPHSKTPWGQWEYYCSFFTIVVTKSCLVWHHNQPKPVSIDYIIMTVHCNPKITRLILDYQMTTRLE